MRLHTDNIHKDRGIAILEAWGLLIWEKKNHNRLEELCNYGPQREHLMKMG